MATVVGLDIGYSNVKVVSGAKGQAHPTRVDVLPAGAGPATALPQKIDGEPDAPHNTTYVVIDGEQWVAGIEPHRLQGSERELHEQYLHTNTYRALLYAALAHVDSDRVETLVTGLPVSQRNDRHYVDAVKEIMTGRHPITGEREVTVDQVKVMSQPSGAFLDFARHTNKPKLLEKGRIVVLDPGFYSTDWVVIEDGKVLQTASGTTTNAVSAMLDALDQRIQQRYGATLGPERLERALRTGDTEIMARGRAIDIQTDLTEIADEIAVAALTETARRMRHDQRSVDALLIAGGGAQSFHEPARNQFGSDVEIIVPDNPVAAHARGFWYFAA